MVDIAFFIDSSGSMTEELMWLEQTVGNFVRTFVTSAKLDFQIWLVAGTNENPFNVPPDIASNPRVEHIDPNNPSYGLPLCAPNGCVTSNDPLGIGLQFIDGQLKTKKLQRRKEAPLEMVFITDDDSIRGGDPYSINKVDWVQYFATHPGAGNVRVNGFVGLPTSVQGANPCSIAAIGLAYIDLGASVLHQGLIQDLCEFNQTHADKLMQKLATSILERAILRRFTLQNNPLIPGPFTVKVSGQEISTNDYVFASSTNTVKINSSYPLKEAELVEISFLSAAAP
jgi:hypothetical protein